MVMMANVCLFGIVGVGSLKENGGAGDGPTRNEKTSHQDTGSSSFDDNGNLPVGHKIALLLTGLTEPEHLAPHLVLPSIIREIITPLGPQNVDCFVHTSSLKGGGEDAVAEVYSRLGQSLAALVYVENYRGPERVHVRRPKRLPQYLHALHGGGRVDTNATTHDACQDWMCRNTSQVFRNFSNCGLSKFQLLAHASPAHTEEHGGESGTDSMDDCVQAGFSGQDVWVPRVWEPEPFFAGYYQFFRLRDLYPLMLAEEARARARYSHVMRLRTDTVW